MHGKLCYCSLSLIRRFYYHHSTHSIQMSICHLGSLCLYVSHHFCHHLANDICNTFSSIHLLIFVFDCLTFSAANFIIFFLGTVFKIRDWAAAHSAAQFILSSSPRSNLERKYFLFLDRLNWWSVENGSHKLSRECVRAISRKILHLFNLLGGCSPDWTAHELPKEPCRVGWELQTIFEANSPSSGMQWCSSLEIRHPYSQSVPGSSQLPIWHNACSWSNTEDTLLG